MRQSHWDLKLLCQIKHVCYCFAAWWPTSQGYTEGKKGSSVPALQEVRYHNSLLQQTGWAVQVAPALSLKAGETQKPEPRPPTICWNSGQGVAEGSTTKGGGGFVLLAPMPGELVWATQAAGGSAGLGLLVPGKRKLLIT